METVGITKTLAVVIVVIVLIAGLTGGYYLLSNVGSASVTQSSTAISASQEQYISRLAYTHWEYVSHKNVSEIYSQYSAEYKAVWFYFNGSSSSALSALNGRHDCNPAGGIDCSYNVKSAWEDFFNDTPPVSAYAVCEYNATIELGNRALVSATVWIEFANGSSISTMRVPYQIDFEYVGGNWQLWKEYFGISDAPTTVFANHVSPPASCAS